MPNHVFDLQSFADHLAPFGVDLPDEAATLLAVRHAALEAAGRQPTDDLAAEVAAGKVTAGNVADKVNAAALALLVRDRAHEVVGDLERTFRIGGAKAVASHGDQLIAALTPRFDETVAALTEAVQAIGAEPDQNAVLNAGPAAAAQWQRYTDSLATLRALRRARADLASAGYGPPETPAWWVANIPTPAAFDRARQQMHGGARFASLIGAGFTLKLNTAAAVDAILANVRSAAEAAEAKVRAQKDAQRQADRAEHERRRDQADEQRRHMLAKANP